MRNPGSQSTRELWIGSYPGQDGPDTGEGIWRVTLERGTGELTEARRVAACPSPSFLAQHPSSGLVYAVDERDDGTVSAFTPTDDGGLTRLWTGASGGTHPCHLQMGPDSVWVSNYGSGTFATVRLNADSTPTGVVDEFAHTGSGPNADRQTAPHVHSSGRTPDGRFAWVADLGTDEIWRYQVDPESTPAGTQPPLQAAGIAVELAAGSGPRHMVFHTAGVAFVAGELDNSVSVVLVDAGTGAGTALQRVAACETTAEIGAYPSEIALNESGTRLYVGVRGPDVVATFAVHTTSDPAAPVTLEYLGDTVIGGQWPRHLAVLSAPEDEQGKPVDRIVVASQNSNELVVLDIDSAGTGVERSRMELPVPPACVLPIV